MLVTGRDLLIPFAIAVMIWYVINALSRLIETHLKFPGWLSLTASIVFFLVALGLIVEMISGNIASVRDAAPAYQANLEQLIERCLKFGGFDEMPTIAHVIEQLDVRALIGGVAGAVAKVAGNAGLIVIYVVFLLAEGRTFSRKIEALFPENDRRMEVQFSPKFRRTNLHRREDPVEPADRIHLYGTYFGGFGSGRFWVS